MLEGVCQGYFLTLHYSAASGCFKEAMIHRYDSLYWSELYITTTKERTTKEYPMQNQVEDGRSIWQTATGRGCEGDDFSASPRAPTIPLGHEDMGRKWLYKRGSMTLIEKQDSEKIANLYWRECLVLFGHKDWSSRYGKLLRRLWTSYRTWLTYIYNHLAQHIQYPFDIQGIHESSLLLYISDSLAHDPVDNVTILDSWTNFVPPKFWESNEQSCYTTQGLTVTLRQRSIGKRRDCLGSWSRPSWQQMHRSEQ